MSRSLALIWLGEMTDQPTTIEMPWGSVTIYTNGNVVAETSAAIVSTSTDGNCVVTFKLQVNKVTLANILDVSAHLITNADENTLHKIAFHDGGSYELSYGKDGTIKHLSGNNISTQISNEGEICVGSRSPRQTSLTTPTSVPIP